MPAMQLDATKLTSLLVLTVSAALIAAACGDDAGDSGSSTGTGGASGATGTQGPGTGSGPGTGTGTGGADDPCDARPAACFDAASCYASPPADVSFRNDLVPLLTRSCTLSSACHTDTSSPTTSEGYKPYLGNKKTEGPPDVALIREAIIDVEAWGDPSRVVVAPGDWEASYFMNKLDGALDDCGDVDCIDCGRLMPQGSPKPLPIVERNRFRSWIEAGAPDN